jgi:hypothetical protein
MQYQSTASHEPFTASSQKEAVVLATAKLGQESGGEAKLVSVLHEGNHSACLAKITTVEKVWSGGEPVQKETISTRRFVVGPRKY